MQARAIQTTVPRDVAEAIDRLAREHMFPTSGFVRQLLVRRVREVQQRQPSQEMPQ
jgi:hypothetical protein